MILLICGSRTWTDRNAILRELMPLSPDTVLHGAAPGADRHAADVARKWGRDSGRGISVVAYPADWLTHGNSAGPRRNAKMLAEGRPDRGLAFGALWRKNRARGVGWVRSGTGDMVSKMLAAKLPVRWVPEPGAFYIDLTEMPLPPTT